MGQTVNPSGKAIINVKTEFCGRTLALEVGRLGFRSSAAVLASYGDTVVLATVMIGETASTRYGLFSA